VHSERNRVENEKVEEKHVEIPDDYEFVEDESVYASIKNGQDTNSAQQA